MLWFAIMKSQPDGPPNAVLEHKADEVFENIKEHLLDELGPKQKFTKEEVVSGFENAFYKYIVDFKHKSIYID